MAKTRHIQKRMAQRGITDRMLRIVETFGVRKGDKIILNKKACDAVEEELKKMLDEVRKARPQGGFVLVEADGKQITTYALNSFSRRLAANDSSYDEQ